MLENSMLTGVLIPKKKKKKKKKGDGKNCVMRSFVTSFT
jgi:hypothetical protein